MARKEGTQDKNTFSQDNSTVVLTVDVESVLLTPSLKAGALYYKRNLACHNYTIYDLHLQHDTCYFWHEASGSLDSDSFALCLMDYI